MRFAHVRERVEALHAQGLAVNVWTVNQAGIAHAMAQAGVDGLIGDDPILIRETLGTFA